MYRIKQIPEDFVVKEINVLEFDKSGQYSYYLLKKRNCNTADALKSICKSWGIREKFVNFAGTKDKVAVTEQYISIRHGSPRSINLKGVSLKFLGKGKERLNLGSLHGNEFEIVIRNIDKRPVKKNLFVNYFDGQRFGKNKDNHVIGKYILKGDYKKACAAIPEMRHYLENKPNDHIGALRSIPKKILKLYVHAYQSHLWNRAAEEISKKTKDNINIPLIGFGTEFEDKETEKMYDRIIKEEKITPRDFINRKMPELSEEGTERDLYVKAENLEIGSLEDDEMNPGKKKVTLKFFLPPGAYATNVVKNLMAS